VELLFNTLHYIHAQGFLHRDIRPENLMRSESDVPYVVDFGFAVKKAQNVVYSGTITTASNRVLEHVTHQPRERYDFQESDDVSSLVKTIYLLQNPSTRSEMPKNNEYQELLVYWKGRPSVWNQALAAENFHTAMAALEPFFLKS